MKDVINKVLATVIAAAIIATATALYSVNTRLTRIETILSIKNQTAKIP